MNGSRGSAITRHLALNPTQWTNCAMAAMVLDFKIQTPHCHENKGKLATSQAIKSPIDPCGCRVNQQQLPGFPTAKNKVELVPLPEQPMHFPEAERMALGLHVIENDRHMIDSDRKTMENPILLDTHFWVSRFKPVPNGTHTIEPPLPHCCRGRNLAQKWILS